jgi:hypothetical protein
MLVGFLHGNLVITGVCVQEGKELAPSGRVHDLINTRERKGVLAACLIEPSVVDTHPLDLVLLLNKHGICDPHWVVYRSYEPHCQESCYLFAYLLAFFFTKAVKPLGNRPDRRLDIQGAKQIPLGFLACMRVSKHRHHDWFGGS